MRPTPEERLWELDKEGASPTEAIKALRAEYGLNVGEGKELLSRHPAYEERHRASEPIRDLMEKAGREISYPTPPENKTSTLDDYQRLYRAWTEATADLGITVEPGGVLGTDTSARYAALIRDFGSEGGCLIAPLHADPDGRLKAAAKEQGRFWSLLNNELYDHYERKLFIEALNDMQWFGKGPSPVWYTGEPWT
jgi:hypothetical protein